MLKVQEVPRILGRQGFDDIEYLEDALAGLKWGSCHPYFPSSRSSHVSLIPAWINCQNAEVVPFDSIGKHRCFCNTGGSPITIFQPNTSMSAENLSCMIECHSHRDKHWKNKSIAFEKPMTRILVKAVDVVSNLPDLNFGRHADLRCLISIAAQMRSSQMHLTDWLS